MIDLTIDDVPPATRTQIERMLQGTQYNDQTILDYYYELILRGKVKP